MLCIFNLSLLPNFEYEPILMVHLHIHFCPYFRLLFSLYLLFMTFLTTSLVLAAKSTDPNVYADGLDWFRLICEIITLIWVLVHLGLEIYELGRVMLVVTVKPFL